MNFTELPTNSVYQKIPVFTKSLHISKTGKLFTSLLLISKHFKNSLALLKRHLDNKLFCLDSRFRFVFLILGFIHIQGFKARHTFISLLLYYDVFLKGFKNGSEYIYWIEECSIFLFLLHIRKQNEFLEFSKKIVIRSQKNVFLNFLKFGSLFFIYII